MNIQDIKTIVRQVGTNCECRISDFFDTCERAEFETWSLLALLEETVEVFMERGEQSSVLVLTSGWVKTMAVGEAMKAL